MIDLETAERLVQDDVVAVSTNRDLLVVSGPDAEVYLHGQLSQDVTGMGVGDTRWTLLLQPQGKVDAWLRMHRAGTEQFLLDTEVGFGETAKARLERFKLRVDVTIVVATVPALALRGPASAATAANAVDGVLALDASWGGVDGVDLLRTPRLDDDLDEGQEAPVDVWLASPVSIAPPGILELTRVRQGRPAMGQELDEGTIPAAAGVVDASVDFTKGCYVGQELVARVDSRGSNTPTRLHRLTVTDPPADIEPTSIVGAALTVDGADAGTVTSLARSPELGLVGLIYLKRSFEAPVSGTVTAPSGQPLPASVEPLPVS